MSYEEDARADVLKGRSAARLEALLLFYAREADAEIAELRELLGEVPAAVAALDEQGCFADYQHHATSWRDKYVAQEALRALAARIRAKVKP